MAEELDWVYYDTVAMGTAADTEKVFFNQNESTSGLTITNMPISGRIPENEVFDVNEIYVYPEAKIDRDDLIDYYDRSITEIKINNNRVFIAPTQMLPGPVEGGSIVDDNAQGATTINPWVCGDVFRFAKPLTIKGGVPFKVIVDSGGTAAATGFDFVVCLRGILKRA